MIAVEIETVSVVVWEWFARGVVVGVVGKPEVGTNYLEVLLAVEAWCNTSSRAYKW